MRPVLALIALAVTTWSNVAVLRCAPAIGHSSGTEAEAVVGHHGHGGQAGRPHDAPPSDDGPGPHPVGTDCGVAMACGTALGGHGAATDRGLPATFAEMASVIVPSPSAADLTRDPPPPRRNA